MVVWAMVGTIGRSQVAGCPTRRLHRPCRARPADRSLVAEDRSAGGVRTGRDQSPPVHGGYTQSRQVEDCNGHERSPRELRNGR
jgi:hypothetical protein